MKYTIVCIALLTNTTFAETYRVCGKSQNGFGAAEKSAEYRLTGVRRERDLAKHYSILQTAAVSEATVDDERILEWVVCFEVSDQPEDLLKPSRSSCTTAGATLVDGLEFIAKGILTSTPEFFPENEVVSLSRSFVFSSDTYDGISALHGWQCLGQATKSESSELCGVAAGSFKDALVELDIEMKKSRDISKTPRDFKVDIAASRSLLIRGKLDWRVCATLL